MRSGVPQIVVRIFRLFTLIEGPVKNSPESGKGFWGFNLFSRTTDLAASRNGISRCHGRVADPSVVATGEATDGKGWATRLVKNSGTARPAPTAREVLMKFRRFMDLHF